MALSLQQMEKMVADLASQIAGLEDLFQAQGQQGVQGVQGPEGIIVNPNGSVEPEKTEPPHWLGIFEKFQVTDTKVGPESSGLNKNIAELSQVGDNFVVKGAPKTQLEVLETGWYQVLAFMKIKVEEEGNYRAILQMFAGNEGMGTQSTIGDTGPANKLMTTVQGSTLNGAALVRLDAGRFLSFNLIFVEGPNPNNIKYESPSENNPHPFPSSGIIVTKVA